MLDRLSTGRLTCWFSGVHHLLLGARMPESGEPTRQEQRTLGKISTEEVRSLIPPLPALVPQVQRLAMRQLYLCRCLRNPTCNVQKWEGVTGVESLSACGTRPV